jgi:predicted TIM-barrel fold metal-dependent hydrolase
MPTDIGIVDTMLDLPYKGRDYARQFEKVLRDPESKSGALKHPAGYMFKNPVEAGRGADPIGDTLREMDRWGIRTALVSVYDELSEQAVKAHPDRFLGQVMVDPADGMEAVRAIVRRFEAGQIVAASFFPSGVGVAIDDKRAYPIYAKCVELDIPVFVNAGVPGPRMPFAPQDVARIDEVCWFFPELKFVMRHGAEPWTALAVKLLLKYPNLYYSTSAFAPKYYPKDIIHFANTRGADKILYAGYYPSGLTLERIFTEMPNVPFKDEVWPKFLRDNALRLLKRS